jgi:hypothetical protein
MRSILLVFPLAVNSFAAGPILFGVRGGVPFNAADTITSSLTNAVGAATRPFEVGPTLGVHLPLGFSVEGDALFHRQSLNFGLSTFNASLHSDSWEFPVMLKFAPGHSLIAPVFGAGVTARHINDFSGLSAIPAFLLNNGSASSNTVGFVAAAGVRFKMGPLNVTPEVRYTRWGGDSFSQSLLNLLPLTRNEASFLVGVTF